tara:strand:- start:2792 stop:3337 length:546 start_codon:yes stop_codon:yes gene_type:complete
MIGITEEIERLARVRPLKDEPRELYLCRVCRALLPKAQVAAETLSPRGYAWMLDAKQRVESGGYPREFEDEGVPVSVANQLFDLLEVEDEVHNKRIAVSYTKLRKPTKESRSADSLRIAQYLLLYPSVGDEGAANELSSTGWMVSETKVSRVRAEMRRVMYALKESGFTVRRPDGSRIIGI